MGEAVNHLGLRVPKSSRYFCLKSPIRYFHPDCRPPNPHFSLSPAPCGHASFNAEGRLFSGRWDALRKAARDPSDGCPHSGVRGSMLLFVRSLGICHLPGSCPGGGAAKEVAKRSCPTEVVMWFPFQRPLVMSSMCGREVMRGPCLTKFVPAQVIRGPCPTEVLSREGGVEVSFSLPPECLSVVVFFPPPRLPFPSLGGGDLKEPPTVGLGQEGSERRGQRAKARGMCGI